MTGEERQQQADQRLDLVLSSPSELAERAFRDPSILSRMSEHELKDLWWKGEILELKATLLRGAVAGEMYRRHEGRGSWYNHAAKVLGTHPRRVYESMYLWDAFNRRQADLEILGITVAISCAECPDPEPAIEYALEERRKGRTAISIRRDVLRLFAQKKRPRLFGFGAPLNFRHLRHEPVDEQGVVFLFGMVAPDLGFLVEGVRSRFPDCHAKRKMGSRYYTVRVEFEFRSLTFQEHGHSADECDLIVCWEHNWPACPIEVLELKSAIEGLDAAQ